MSNLAPALTARSLLWLLVAAVPVVVVSMLTALFAARGLTSWYPALNKPFLLLPDTTFSLVWTLFYALMTLASWRILRARDRGKARALTLYAFQLGLNLLWPYVFFVRESPWGRGNGHHGVAHHDPSDLPRVSGNRYRSRECAAPEPALGRLCGMAQPGHRTAQLNRFPLTPLHTIGPHG